METWVIILIIFILFVIVAVVLVILFLPSSESSSLCPPTYFVDPETGICTSKCALLKCPIGSNCDFDTGLCQSSCLTGVKCPGKKSCNMKDGNCLDSCPCTDPFATCYNNQCIYIPKYVYISSKGFDDNNLVLWRPFSSRYLINSQCGDQYLQFAPGIYSILIYFEHGPNSQTDITFSAFTGTLSCVNYPTAGKISCIYNVKQLLTGRYSQALYITVQPPMSIVLLKFSNIIAANITSTINLEIEKLN